MQDLRQLKAVLEKYNQLHLLKFWDQLSLYDREIFLKQLNSIDLKNAKEIFDRTTGFFKEKSETFDKRMQPVPQNQYESEMGVEPQMLEEYRKIGLKVISENSVAVLLLAGGQGTRLGVSYPKGMFPVDLPSGKTLYQLQAERIRRVVRLARDMYSQANSLCWYIMTSNATHDDTVTFFEKHSYFDLNKSDVVMFKQGLFPCFTFEGKILLEEKKKVALAPDGNGGLYQAMKENGIVKDMKRRGIKYIHVHSVDNILVKVADPVFIGYCVKRGSDCGAKVIKKEDPKEPVGVICKIDETFQVVEYSEITELTASLRHTDGNLVYRAGSICNHFFTMEFLERVVEHHENELPLHVAKKKIPYIDDSGDRKTPSLPNGIKIEKFVFDVFRFARNFVIWEVPRFSEFSPLKNCERVSKDCPSSVRRDLLNLHKFYIEQSGGTVYGDVEISPLVSYSGENLEDKVKGNVFYNKNIIYADEELCNGF